MRLSYCKHFLMPPLLCLLLFAGSAMPKMTAAQEAPRYQLETLIFAIVREADEGERWRPEENLYFPARMAYLGESGPVPETGENDAPLPQESTQGPSIIQALPTTAAYLADIREKLEARGEFRILFHELWEQPVYDEGNAPYVLVRGGRTYGEHRELEGVLQLSINRYLHLEADLRLSTYRQGRQRSNPWPLPAVPPLPEAETALPAGRIRQVVQVLDGLWKRSKTDLRAQRTVRLRQHRRMRSGELHYLDHPALGMLVLVRPAGQ